MRNLPSPQQLRYFLAVADELNFGRAARRCHVSQSTISGSIVELENSLSARLLERSKRHVELTREGAAMAVQARDILHRLEDIADLAHSLQGPLTGGLRLGVIPTIAPFLLPDLFTRLKRGYPDIRAHLTEDLSPNLLEKIRGGAIDCAILALPYSTGDLVVEELFPDRLLVAFGRTTEFPIKAKGVTSAALRRETLLLLNDGHCLKDQALAACKLNAADVSVSFEAAGLMTLMGMVDRGLGVTFVPELAVRSVRKCFPRISYAPLAERGASRRIALCWRKGSHRQPDFEIIADMVRELNPLG
jgi:LysR family transcriptional regulator, hydrogen peroxide-inducible genes activator